MTRLGVAGFGANAMPTVAPRFRRLRLCARLAGVAAVVLAGSIAEPAHAAGADEAAEQRLADQFAPVVRLVHQDTECGPGEPFRPSDVDAVLDNSTVALRGPWDQNDLVAVAPAAEDLGAGLSGYHLDFPGNPLEPGCDYERWARTATTGFEATTYAHVAVEPGRGDRLAVQYWFFYPFNDYTNKHEGDWEMVQLLFATTDATRALDQLPIEVAYTQHEGAEVADWEDQKLQIVDGTHPVVYVAAGSHANFYDSALYLGRSAEQGFGCDNTVGPSDDVRPVVAVLPSDQAAAEAAYPWIAYQGHWGQREEAFYNGPTGPNSKDSWTHPVTFQEDEGRDSSLAVPAGGLLGTSATDFFCSAVSGGSEVVRKLVNNPQRLLLTLALLAALVIYLIRRTDWQPGAPLRTARRRAAGQVIVAAGRMYAARWRLFTGIGSLTVPVSLLVAGVQSLILDAPDAVFSSGGEGAGLRVMLAALVTFLISGMSLLLVITATTHALDEVDRDNEIGVRGAYRLALTRWRSLLGAFLVSSGIVSLFTVTVVLAPVALVLAVLFALYGPVIALEGLPARGAMRRSATLVRQQPVKTAILLAASILLAGIVGPVLGTLLILVTGAPFPLVNIVAGITYALLIPYVGLTVAYLYFDAQVHAHLAGEDAHSPVVLPAEMA